MTMLIRNRILRALTVYKTASNITIRTFPHLRELDRDNLLIFKEIYQNKPADIPAPAVNLPEAPERPVERNEDERLDMRRQVEMTRKVEAFQQKFTDIAKICDGKISGMGAGAVDHWLDQVKAANDLYDKLYNEIPDTAVINFHDVSFPGEEGGPRVSR